MPTWEHGYRCHGFWDGLTRVGRVSIGPRAATTVARDGYGCQVVHPKTGKWEEWREPTLARAKRSVEVAYFRIYPPPADAPVCDLCEKPGHEVRPVRPRTAWGAAVTTGNGFDGPVERWCYACRRSNPGRYASA